jgi:hypothetical protein
MEEKFEKTKTNQASEKLPLPAWLEGRSGLLFVTDGV